MSNFDDFWRENSNSNLKAMYKKSQKFIHFWHENSNFQVQDKSCSLVLHHCGTGELSLKGLPFHLNGLHFGLEDHLPTRIYEELAKGINGSQQVMTSLTLPQIPPMFVPLILANHGNITGKKTINHSV